MDIDIDKIKQPRYSEYLWMTECKPEKYAKADYIVFSPSLGHYTKKEATVICEFLKHLYTFLK